MLSGCGPGTLRFAPERVEVVHFFLVSICSRVSVPSTLGGRVPSKTAKIVATLKEIQQGTDTESKYADPTPDTLDGTLPSIFLV